MNLLNLDPLIATHPANIKTNELGTALYNNAGKYHIHVLKKSLSYLDPDELWRKLKSLKALFSRNKELYDSREVTENTVPSKGKSSSSETKTTENQ